MMGCLFLIFISLSLFLSFTTAQIQTPRSVLSQSLRRIGSVLSVPFLMWSTKANAVKYMEEFDSLIDFKELRNTVNRGGVYYCDNFIDATLLQEMRDDIQHVDALELFKASGLSNKAQQRQDFDSKKDRSVVALKGDNAYDSVILQKMKSKLSRLQNTLSVVMDRPDLNDDNLAHELYYSMSKPGSFLKRHMDERHPELSRRGFDLQSKSRRSISFLIYLSDDDNWSIDQNGGQLRAFLQQDEAVNIRNGGDATGNGNGDFQIGWLQEQKGRDDENNLVVEPLYLDSFVKGYDESIQSLIPVCKMFLMDNTGQKKYISAEFEVRNPTTGAFERDFNQFLLPEYNKYNINMLEDVELWNQGKDPPSTIRLDINPKPGRLVVFDSVIVPHEVCEVKQGTRLALAGWFHQRAPKLPKWVLNV
jgi:hypothetical protein